MIRPTAPDDAAQILSLAQAALGFESSELGILSASLDHYFEGKDEAFWLIDEGEAGVGAAYCAPEQMTNGTWNLLFIAVHPKLQGQGRGTAMVQSVEQRLAQQGARLLLVETLASFERTRAFYRKCGYEEEACIRDFYDSGADKVTYRKILATEQR